MVTNEQTCSIRNLDGVRDSMRDAVRRFAEIVREVAADRLGGLTLFGSVLDPSFDPDRRPARSVLVVQEIDLKALRRLSINGMELGKLGFAAPLIMTPEYIHSSQDTFPLELLDIQQRHITVLGKDDFVDIELEDAHIRLQCERECKGVLIGLRQGLLASAGRDRFLEQLEREVAEGLVRTMRGMLWLKGQRDVTPVTEIVSEMGRLADRNLNGIRRALDLTGSHGWQEFEALYRDVEALGAMADAL